MKIPVFFRTILLCLLFQITMKSQVSIINISVQPFNITPEALLNVGIMNNENEKQVQILTQLYSSNNVILLTVKSQSFKLLKGLNSGTSGNRGIASVEYSSSSQANYLKTTHNLASGRYKICSSILVENGADKIDDYCDELEADFNQYLYLVNPLDGDTVETKNPILSWTHSEPFTLLNQGEFYRMIVSEIKKDQSAEEAITINTPAMVKNYLKEHQVQYPYDAKELNDGSKYAWQVQKMSDGVVVNKTESWVFNTKAVNELKSLKYVALKNQLDGSYYNAYDGKVYFKFSEEYKSQGQLKFNLTDAKSKQIDIDIKQDKEKNKNGASLVTSELKASGDNRYELNLDAKKLNSGFYTLEIKNEKNESFYLKIFLP